MRVQNTTRIRAPREKVWAVVSDPRRYRDFMANLTLWEHAGGEPVGCGARWNVRWQIGSAPVGGLVEVTEFEPPGDLAFTSLTGLDIRGRWRLREREKGCTETGLRLVYRAPGGVLALLADRVAAPLVGRTIKQSLQNLQQLIEAG